MKSYDELIKFTDEEWEEYLGELGEIADIESFKKILIEQVRVKEMNETRTTFYHFTTKEIAEDIEYEGILTNVSGHGIYVCKDINDVLKFINIRVPKVKLDSNGEIIEVMEKSKLEDLIIIEFLADDSLFEESFDHASEYMGGAKAWVSYEEEVEIEIVEFYDVVQNKC